MKKWLVWAMLSMILLVGCQKEHEESESVIITENESNTDANEELVIDNVTGIDFDNVLDDSRKSIESLLSQSQIRLTKDENLLGTYYISESIAGYDVAVTLQYGYYADPELENWESERPIDEHQLAWYSKSWNWEKDEYREDDYKYIISVYETLCEKYGEPYQLQEGPEGYKIGEDSSTGFSVLWKTGDYKDPNVFLAYTIDGMGAELLYKVEGEYVATM